MHAYGWRHLFFKMFLPKLFIAIIFSSSFNIDQIYLDDMYEKFLNFSGIRYFVNDFFFHVENTGGFQANSYRNIIFWIFLFLY